MQDQAAIDALVGEAMCYMGAGPKKLARLGEFLDRQRADPQWSEADILTVSSRVELLLRDSKTSQ